MAQKGMIMSRKEFIMVQKGMIIDYGQKGRIMVQKGMIMARKEDLWYRKE